jgi:hypothetical protein
MPQCQFLFFIVFLFQKSCTRNILGIGRNNSQTSYLSRHEDGVQSRDGCHDPDFSRIKISSCIHGILHFKVFFKVLNFILQRIWSNALFPKFRYKRLSERKYFIYKLHCYGAILYFPFVLFLLKTK